MFTVFSEVASDLPSYSKTPIKAAFSASYAANAPAEALGIKTLPSVRPRLILHGTTTHVRLRAESSRGCVELTRRTLTSRCGNPDLALRQVLLFKPGSKVPETMTIPRKRQDFTEDALVDWLQGHLK